MSLKTFLLSESTKVTIRIGSILAIIGIVAAAVFWISDVENSIMTNKTSIDRVESVYSIEREEIYGLIKENTDDIKLMSPTLVEIQTDLKWIRAAMEKQ